MLLRLGYNVDIRSGKGRRMLNNVKERIKMSILLEKMYRHKSYSEKLGLEDVSRFHGRRIQREEKR